MRTFLSVLFAMGLAAVSFAQSKPTCCSAVSATQEFAMLTGDNGFNLSHAEPLPYTFNEDIGEMIYIKTAEGKSANAFQILTPYKTNKWLFVFHEWWGLNDYMKKEAVKYFQALKDVNVLVIDLYDGQVATTREEAGKLMGGLDDARARSIIQGAIKFVGKQADIATLGWCMGGGWSLQATLMAGKQATGAVMYYGMPEKDLEKIKTLQADVLFVHAQKDDWITTDVVKQFQDKMKTAGKSLQVKEYDAVHAFANPSNPNHDRAAAENAFNESVRFLSKRFYLKGG